jgi:hypothetical protein
MANRGKRISELTELTSASLDTTIVGIDGGTTYKIELDTLADAVTLRVNTLDRERLQSLESVTSSFEVNGRSIVSSSAQITALGFISSSTTIPIGTISSSTQISDFGFVSTSVDITSLNSFTASQSTLNTAFTNGITARLQTSSFNEYTASQSTSSLVNRLDAIESVSGSWITESETGSFLTSLSGAISSSSQLTSSYDTRYTLSGSVQPLPSNLVSSSAQITAFGFISSSTAIPAGTISGSSQLTSSFDTRYILSGSLTAGSNVSVSDTAPTSPTEGDLWWKSDDGNLYVYYDSYWVVATDTISAIPNGVISGSAQITTLGFVSGSYETTGRGIISGSAQLPSGLISGSSQLTTSFPSKTIGTWTLPTGASIQSFIVEAGHTYSMWVNGNIPNGIITWNATVTLSNTNVPAVGSQYGWYYVDGNAIVLTSIPDQIIGTNGGIISSPSSYPPNTSNVFKFGITNNSGTTQTINYGYIKLS